MLEKVVFSAALGGLIGIEREFDRREKKSIPMGVRTLMLISMLGCLISSLENSNLLIGLGFVSILIISSLSFYIRSRTYKDMGLTTYGAGFITYFIGVFVGLDEFLVAVIITIITTLILSISKELHYFTGILTRNELRSTITFAIIAFVILPLLPNEAIDSFGLFNPFSFWFIVVVMSGLSFASYILLRLTHHGLSITGFLGGFISSKATIYEISSKHKKVSNEVVNASLLSISAAIVSDLVFFLLVTRDLVFFSKLLIPVLVSVSLILLIFLRRDGVDVEKLSIANPFTLSSSLKNALVIFVFTQLIYVINKFVSPSFMFLSVALGAMVSGTATVISTGTLYALGLITPSLMVVFFMITALVSVLDKFFIIKFSNNNELLKKISKPLISMSLLLFVSFLISYFIPI